jgi:hypothetical protein
MPFTVNEFFAVFADYNAELWPLQIVAYLVGLLIVVLLRRPSRSSDMMILWALAALWAVNGIGYHLLHFAAINPAARLFAILFIVEAALLAASPYLWRQRIIFDPRRSRVTTLGFLLMLFALIGYPALSFLAGHRYPAMPMFGVAPCPTTIFTIGVLMLGDWKVTRWLLIAPVLWSFIGGSAALLLNVPQDYALILSGILVVAFAAGRLRLPQA